MIDHSIVIVNYRTSGFILDCLRSIVPAKPENMEIIIVDNFSQDNSEELITGEFPEIRWIQMGYNSGFARANNAGIRASTGQIVLLLNPDTLNEHNAIAQCFDRLHDSDHIACGVQLLNPDRTPQISGNYFMTGGLNHLMALPYLGRLARAAGLLFKVKKTNVPEAVGKVEVDWINGAFLMVKKTAIAKAGLLDEDFFLYSEEIEWCSRLGRFGKMYIDGELNVIHLEGSSANKEFGSEGKGYHQLDDRKGLQLMLSGLVRIRKQFGIFWLIVHWLAVLVTIPVYFLAVVFKSIFFTSRSRREWKGWVGFTSNFFRTSTFLFSIIRNQPRLYKVL